MFFPLFSRSSNKNTRNPCKRHFPEAEAKQKSKDPMVDCWDDFCGVQPGEVPSKACEA